MLRYALISLALTILAVVLAPYDSVITQAIDMTAETGDDRRIMALSEIFAHGFGVAVIVALVIALAPTHARKIPRLLTCLLLSGVAIHFVKHLVFRRRPQSYGQMPELATDTWQTAVNNSSLSGWNTEYLMQSFPSGHSATAFCVALGLTWMFPRGRYVFFTLAAMAMLQRIMFLAHWPSDVLFGAAIATMVAANVFASPLANWVFHSFENSKKAEPPSLIEFPQPASSSRRRAA